MSGGTATPAFSQRVVRAIRGGLAFTTTDSAGEQETPPTFVLPTQPNDITEALEDFQRHSEAGRWEQAFQSLDKVVAASGPGFVRRPDGVMVPPATLLRTALGELSPAGKEAYRLFHDAEARTLLGQASGAQEIEQLNRIVSKHLITSVGDAAADRLGDLYFEAGQMDKAAEAWRLVLDYCPESQLSRPLLLTKLGIALARAGRALDLADVREQLLTRHAGETVRLGGRDVDPVSHLATLVTASGDSGSGSSITSRLVDDVALPVDDRPLWQFHMLSQRDRQAMRDMANNWGWNRFPAADMSPPVVLDAGRVYINLFGYRLALDRQSGKLLWRSAKFNNLSQKFQNGPYLSAERYAIGVSPGKLWYVARDAQQLGQYGSPFYLSAVDPADGKELLSSRNVGEIQQLNFSGRPLVVGDRVYVAAYPNGQGTELTLYALNVADLKPAWNTKVGNHQTDMMQMYYRRAPLPVLFERGGMVYVDTHDGAFVTIDASNGQLLWAATYPSAALSNDYYYGQTADPEYCGDPFVSGGTVYFKGMSSTRLMNVDLASASLRWRRPIEKSALIVGADEDRLYVGGDGLSAIDMASQQMLWSTRLPTGGGMPRPVITRSHVYQFTPRGVFEIDKATGDVTRMFRGADLDAAGGTLFIDGGQMITVSSHTITAYSLGTPEDQASEPTAATSAGN